MPRFSKLDPRQVQIGRGRAAFDTRKKYLDAVKSSQAGSVDLEGSERPATVKRLLHEAAKEAGIKVRSSWTDNSQKTLIWKRTASSR